MAIPIIISTPMLNKLRTMFTKYQNTRRSEAILDLCEQNNYAQVAKNLSTYQKYQNVRIENYPFVYYLLGIVGVMQRRRMWMGCRSS